MELPYDPGWFPWEKGVYIPRVRKDFSATLQSPFSPEMHRLSTLLLAPQFSAPVAPYYSALDTLLKGELGRNLHTHQVFFHTLVKDSPAALIQEMPPPSFRLFTALADRQTH